MNPPTILLDRSFLIAVADDADADHDAAVACYRSLLDDFVAERCLIMARADHLAAAAEPDLFAAVGKVHVARQHRSAAANLRGDHIDPDLAITLVMIHRLRIRTVATFDERLARYEVTTLPTSNFVGHDSVSESAATTFESEVS